MLNSPFEGFNMDGDWLNIMIVLRDKSFDGAEEECCFTTEMLYLYLFRSLSGIHYL